MYGGTLGGARRARNRQAVYPIATALMPAVPNGHVGPFQDSSTGYLWALLFDAANTLNAWRSTDGGVTWASQATLALTTHRNQLDVVYDDTAKKLYAACINASTSGLYVYQYTLGGSITELSSSTSRPVSGGTDLNVQHPYQLVRRSDGTFVLLYQDTQETVGGTAYNRYSYVTMSAAGVWGAPVTPDSGVAADYNLKAAVLGAADRVHWAFSNTPTALQAQHHSLSSAGVLDAAVAITTVPGGSARYRMGYSASLGKLYFAFVSGDRRVYRATSQAAPTWAQDANDFTAGADTSTLNTLIYDGYMLHAFYRAGVAVDSMYHDTAQGTSTTWDGEQFYLAQVYANSVISPGLLADGIGLLYGSTGTQAYYNEYVTPVTTGIADANDSGTVTAVATQAVGSGGTVYNSAAAVIAASGGYANDAEGGVAGATIATTDVGSGTAPGVVLVEAGAVFGYANDVVLMGSMSYQYASHTVGARARAQWTRSGGTTPSDSGGTYFSLDATPTANTGLCQFRVNGGAVMAYLSFNLSGGNAVIAWRNGSEGTVATMATALVPGTRYRLEWTVTANGTTSVTVDLALYLGDNTTALETGTQVVPATVAVAAWDTVIYGIVNAPGSVQPTATGYVRLDGIRAFTGTSTGPWPSTAGSGGLEAITDSGTSGGGATHTGTEDTTGPVADSGTVQATASQPSPAEALRDSGTNTPAGTHTQLEAISDVGTSTAGASHTGASATRDSGAVAGTATQPSPGEVLRDSGTQGSTGTHTQSEAVADSTTSTATASHTGTEGVAGGAATDAGTVQATAAHTGAEALTDAGTQQAVVQPTGAEVAADSGTSQATAAATGTAATADTATVGATGSMPGTEALRDSGSPGGTGSQQATEVIADTGTLAGTGTTTGTAAATDSGSVQATGTPSGASSGADTGTQGSTGSQAAAEAIADVGGTIAATGTLAPASLVATTNLGGTVADVQDDPASPDGAWLAATDPDLQTVAEVRYVPPAQLQGTQVVRVLARAVGDTQNVRIDVYQGGTLVHTGTPQPVTSPAGAVVSEAFDAAVLADPAAPFDVVAVGGPGV